MECGESVLHRHRVALTQCAAGRAASRLAASVRARAPRRTRPGCASIRSARGPACRRRRSADPRCTRRTASRVPAAARAAARRTTARLQVAARDSRSARGRRRRRPKKRSTNALRREHGAIRPCAPCREMPHRRAATAADPGGADDASACLLALGEIELAALESRAVAGSSSVARRFEVGDARKLRQEFGASFSNGRRQLGVEIGEVQERRRR